MFGLYVIQGPNLTDQCGAVHTIKNKRFQYVCVLYITIYKCSSVSKVSEKAQLFSLEYLLGGWRVGHGYHESLSFIAALLMSPFSQGTIGSLGNIYKACCLLYIHIHPYSDHLSGRSIRKLKWGADETEWFNAPAFSLCLWGPPAVPQNKCGLWTKAIWMQAHHNLSFIEAKLRKPLKNSIAGVLVPPLDFWYLCL